MVFFLIEMEIYTFISCQLLTQTGGLTLCLSVPCSGLSNPVLSIAGFGVRHRCRMYLYYETCLECTERTIILRKMISQCVE